MQQPSGINRTNRLRLATVLRATKGTISPEEVASILSISREIAAKLLSRWAAAGWIARAQGYVGAPAANLASI